MALSNISAKSSDVIYLLAKFELQVLDVNWINEVINSDFSEVEDFPPQFSDIHESTNFSGLFTAVNSKVREFVDLIQADYETVNARKNVTSFLSTSSLYEDDYNDSDECTKFWINLTKLFNVKSILSFVFYFNYKGNIFSSNEDDRELSILAANLYFLLLAVPGSNAFQIFHPVLYIKALNTLKLTTKLNIADAIQKKGGSRSQRRSSSDEKNENLEDVLEISSIDTREANKLIRLLNILLNDFMRLSKILSLKHSSNLLEDTISVLIQVTRCERHNAKEVFIQRHTANSTSALCYNSYVALQGLCTPLHGSVKKTVTLIAKYILVSILMTFYGSSELSTRALGVIKEHSTIFMKYLKLQLGEDSFEGVFILVQHLCLRVPDKAEFREKIAKTVVELIGTFPGDKYSQCMKWLYQFSYNEKASHRLFTLEVVSKLLAEDERKEDVQIPANSDSSNFNASAFPSVAPDNAVPIPINRDIFSHKFLLCIIFSRCRDVAAMVRSKALNLLAECTLSDQPTIIDVIKQIFLQKEPVVFTTPYISEVEANIDSPYQCSNFTYPNSEMILMMLHRRSLDGRVTVRKSALQVMENLLKLDVSLISDALLENLLEHCRDPALLIRKQVVQSLSSVVATYPDNEKAIQTWVKGVLPLSLDPEARVQEKVVEFFDQLICCRICHYDNFNFTEDQILPWRIFDVVNRLSFQKFLNKIFLMWSKSEWLRPQIVRLIESHVDKEFNSQAWSFLSVVSQFLEVKNPQFALCYFEQKFMNEREVSTMTARQVLEVLCNSIKYIDDNRALALRKTLLDSLNSFTVDVQLISVMVNAVTLITFKLEGEDENGIRAVEQWAHPILKSCDDYLKQILFPKKPSSLSVEEEEELFRHLFTLGEVAQFCPAKVNKRMFLMLQSIIFHQKGNSNVASSGEIRIPSSQTQSSQPPAISFRPTTKLQNLAVVTIAKMCLQHEDQAKRIIPAMGRMLESTSVASMKINIMVALSDMCVRYATLVDPLMPQVTLCLRDPDVEVRRTTLTLLISLLQEDYLKLKESFFYRILQCLCDQDEEVRNIVNFYMTERLLKRSPKIFLQHFIECIFHYNAYEEHESYNKFSQSNQEKTMFSMVGSKYREERMKLYCFMLDHMQDDQRFATTQRLCQDVLGGVVDGRIKLTPSSLPMLEDTLMVLSSEEIKLAWLKSGGPDDADQPANQDEQAEMAGIAIKKTIISQVVKKNVIENIVPILIALKHKLEENRSPLMRQLLLYFKEIMKDYKNEVREILAGDKLIAKEIEFDLRRLDEEEQARQADLSNSQRKLRHGKRKPGDGKQLSIGNSPKLPRSPEGEIESRNDDCAMNSTEDGSAAAIAEDKDNDPTKKDDDNNMERTTCNDEISGQKGIDYSSKDVSRPLRKERLSLRRETLHKNQSKVFKELESSRLPKETSVHSSSSEPLREKVASSKTDRDIPVVQEDSNVNPADPVDSAENIDYDCVREQDPRATAKNDSEKISRSTASSEVRENLLRAISTPNPAQKVIRNVTFIDTTQNLSNITFGSSSLTVEEENSADNSTLLLHFNSPNAFRKDEQFNKLRRSSRNDVRNSKEDKKESDIPGTASGAEQPLKSKKVKGRKRSSIGFMESIDRETSPASSDSSDFTL